MFKFFTIKNLFIEMYTIILLYYKLSNKIQNCSDHKINYEFAKILIHKLCLSNYFKFDIIIIKKDI